MTVLVSHPQGAAVANATAEALDRHDLLAAYVSGVIGSRRGGLPGAVLSALSSRYPALGNRVVDVGRPRLRSLRAVEFSSRMAQKLRLFRGSRFNREATTFAVHDVATALLAWPKKTTVVYAYEDAARYTFQRAARRGIHRVWDLPLPHYAAIERMWREEGERWPGAMGSAPLVEPAWKKLWKDEELRRATHISVASEFTKKSLEELGARQPIFVLPYGFPVESFVPKTTVPAGPFTVLVVGIIDLRKGTPYILEAWKKAGLRDAQLRFIGDPRLSSTFLDRYAGSFEHVPWMPRARLGDEYRAADVLVFPTLGDGFGLVMQEAMCCGTPVITTPCGGGPECIADGVDGFVVPPRDADALADRLRQVAADRAGTFAMGQRARRRAEGFTWREAGEAIALTLGALM